MTSPSPRRRFQFSLRTLLIGVTLLCLACGYVAWQAKIVRERKGALVRLYKLGGACETVSEYRSLLAVGWFKKSLPESRIPTVSWLRARFGDEAIMAIYVPPEVSQTDFQEIVDEIPEAIPSRILEKKSGGSR